MPQILVTAAVLLFPALLLTAAVSDALTLRIPNWISIALIAAFPLAAFATGMSWTAAGVSVGVGLAGLVVGVTLWTLRWIGGGDAKVFAAAALWMGWPTGLVFAIGTMLAGGVLALFVLGLRTTLIRSILVSGPPWVARLTDKETGLPYGVAICLGGIFAFFQSPYYAALGG